EWVGLDVFKYMFSLGDSKTIFVNTIVIALGKIVGNLVVPLIFALLLNEVRLLGVKKSIQTIVYLPYFISWVILAGIMQDLLGYTGPINMIIQAFGGDPTIFLAKSEWFRQIIIMSDVWKNFGYNAIIYLAALTAISPTLYESAAIDGAGRFRRMLYITIPGIAITVVLLMILSLGNILNAGFDQVFNLYNPLVFSTGDIIDTWVYRTGLLSLQFSLATAVGLLKSVIGFVLITVGYFFAHKYANYRIF
ncbi:MAG: sugar ABC transporter permease, partial [Vallitaleaceae bacterium]|nr:sugar ABC transporter permease [Vallitaleaceae bacterium]